MANSHMMWAWLKYWLNAVDDHSLHAPFLFDFYNTVMKGKTPESPAESIEVLRGKLLSDNRPMMYEDLGSPRTGNTVGAIARHSLSPAKYSALFYRIACYIDAQQIVELGTSFGINTLYLAMKKEATVHTFEGVREVADIAELTFEFSGASNVQLHFGKIENTLPAYLQGVRKVDLAYIDANHHYESTVWYFKRLLPRLHEHSVVVVDDIHRSGEMELAWREITENPLVYTTIDLFHCGIAFFDPSLSRLNVTLEF